MVFTPVCVFSAVTVALGTTALVASITVPTISPLMACAHKFAKQHRQDRQDSQRANGDSSAGWTSFVMLPPPLTCVARRQAGELMQFALAPGCEISTKPVTSYPGMHPHNLHPRGSLRTSTVIRRYGGDP